MTNKKYRNVLAKQIRKANPKENWTIVRVDGQKMSFAEAHRLAKAIDKAITPGLDARSEDLFVYGGLQMSELFEIEKEASWSNYFMDVDGYEEDCVRHTQIVFKFNGEYYLYVYSL